MNRKYFLSSIGALATGLSIPFAKPLLTGSDDEAHIKKPRSLKPGDLIGLTAPAGFIKPEEVSSAVQIMESWGYKIKLGDTIGKRDNTFGGTDAERIADLQSQLDDPDIKAIMCARGGYGVVRIVDQLNWTKFKQHPKWIIGFSDITVLHSHIHRHCNLATIHSKMTNSFPDEWAKADTLQAETILSIRDALAGKPLKYSTTPHLQNRQGSAAGTLVGGNLKLLESLSGTPSDISTAGKILFVEDTGEYLYSIDRMFWNLKRTGKLKHLKGLVVGGFRIKPDDEGEAFGKSLQDIVLEKIKNYNYPVCFDFPVGHQRANFALKCGVKHQLKVTTSEVTLTEIV